VVTVAEANAAIAKHDAAPTRSLHRKLAQIMFEAERIPKNGVYDGPGRFRFVQAGDAADVIRKALAEKNVSMIPSSIELLSESEHETAKGGTMTTMTVRTTWTLTDGESGETAVIQSMGSGADTGDKASPKAQTNAMKYALLMGFLLSTGDDPELSDSSDRRPRKGETIEANGDAPNDGSLIGTVVKGKPPCDLELRETPDGPIAGFKLAQGRSGLQVLASGNLASALQPFLAGLVDSRVSCWGSIEMVPWEKDGKTMPAYKRMALSRIKTPDFILPGVLPEAQTSDGPEGDGPPGNAVEAESAPLFTEGEWAGV
jgi:hypothetical protein